MLTYNYNLIEMINFIKIVLTLYLISNFAIVLAKNTKEKNKINTTNSKILNKDNTNNKILNKDNTDNKILNKDSTDSKILNKNAAKKLPLYNIKTQIDDILNNKYKNKLILRPYIDFGYRITLWASHGLMNTVNPFKNNKIPEINDFNFNTNSIQDAICIKGDDEINKYSFAKDYGIKIDLAGLKKNPEGNTEYIYKIYDGIKFLYKKINDIKISKPNDSGPVFNLLQNENINIQDIIGFLITKDLKDIPIAETVKNVYENIYEAIKNLNVNSNINLIKNKTQKLSQYYLINVVKLFFIKNAIDTYVNEYTAKCFNNYSKNTNTNLDDLIKQIDDLTSDPLNTKLKDIFELYPDDEDYKNTCNKLKYKLNELHENNEITLGSFINLISTKLKISDSNYLFPKIQKIISKFKSHKNSEENIKKLNVLTENLKKYNLLDDNLLGNEYIDDKSINSSDIKNLDPNENKNNNKNTQNEKLNETIKHIRQLLNRLKKLKSYEKNKNKLKSLGKENFEWLHPFNYRGGLNLTYYFNKKIGINFDISVSYSTLGFKKSFFLPVQFIDQMFFYLIKMHEPILAGRLIDSKNISMKDIIYKGNDLNIADLLIEDLFNRLGTNSCIFGNERYKDKFALNEYLNVINQYSDSQYILVDCLVKLTQINLCLKSGVVFNLNNLFKNNNIIKENKIYNELIINGGIYFNFQRLKMNVTLNPNSDIPRCGKNELYNPTTTVGILYKALRDILINLDIVDTADEGIFRSKCSSMLYKIITNLYCTDIIPQNNNILGYINNVTSENLDERSATGVFNTFKIRPLIELIYRITIYGYSISLGCEFIFTGPLNNKFYNNNTNFDKSDSNSKFKIPFNFEILPHISFSKCFNIL